MENHCSIDNPQIHQPRKADTQLNLNRRLDLGSSYSEDLISIELAQLTNNNDHRLCNYDCVHNSDRKRDTIESSSSTTRLISSPNENWNSSEPIGALKGRLGALSSPAVVIAEELESMANNTGYVTGFEPPQRPIKPIKSSLKPNTTPPTGPNVLECLGRRRQPIGEKCFTLIMVFFVAGVVLTGFGATCLVPVKEGVQQLYYCKPIGGLITALVILSGGVLLIILGAVSCILINECSGRELHGGKCHINCHIFEDLVE